MSRLSECLRKYGFIPLDELEKYTRETGYNLYMIIQILNDAEVPMVCARNKTDEIYEPQAVVK